MHRLFITPGSLTPPTLALRPSQAHHLRTVLNAQPHDSLLLLSPTHSYQVTLQKLRKNSLEFVLNHQQLLSPPQGPQLTLAQCLPKQDKLAEIFRGCTELGVHRFIPLLSERTLAKPVMTPAKLDRWEMILESAAIQSRRLRKPILDPLLPLSHLPEQVTDHVLKLVFWEEESTYSLKDCLHPFLSGLENPPGPILALIGPEGGLAASEIDRLRAHGFQSVRMGETILRVEHAGLVACSQLLYALTPGRTGLINAKSSMT